MKMAKPIRLPRPGTFPGLLRGSMVFLCGLLCMYGASADSSTAIEKALEEVSMQLHRETGSPFLVLALPDESCGKEPVDSFSSTMQLRQSEKRAVTLLRYWDNRICVETYVESETGNMRFGKNGNQAAAGVIPEGVRYRRADSLAFLFRGASDWARLARSIPRYASLENIRSVARRIDAVQTEARSLAKAEAAEDRPSVTEGAHKSVVPGTFMAFFVIAGAGGSYWGRRKVLRRRVDKPIAAQRVVPTSTPVRLVLAPFDGQEANPITSLMATLKKMDIPETEMQRITKKAMALFERLNNAKDVTSLVKVRHYLAGELSAWHAKAGKG